MRQCRGAAAAAALCALLPLQACRADVPSWGGVSGAEVEIAANGSGVGEGCADAAAGLGAAVEFARTAVEERWAACSWCCAAAGLHLAAVERASVQVVSLSKDGRRAQEVRLLRWDGAEEDGPLQIAAVWRMTLRLTHGHASARPPATAAEHAARVAFSLVRHQVTLFVDREGAGSVVRHTWEPLGAPQWRPPPYRLWTPQLSALHALPRPPVHHLPFARTMPLPLSLIVYNIWNVNFPWPARLKLLSDIIAADPGPPDLVAFQEVRYDSAAPMLGPSATRHQMDHLAWRMSRLGHYQKVWEPAMSYSQLDQGLAFQVEGPAIFSRLPVLHVQALHMKRFWPRDSGDEHQRLALGVTVQTEQLGAVNLITTHLSLSDDARLHNAWELCGFADRMEQREGGGRITLLTGDLNMEPHDPAMRFLLGREQYRGRTCNFKDVWELPGFRGHDLEGEEGVDWRDGVTFNNLQGHPVKRIDFVLARGPVPDIAFFAMEAVGAKQTQPAQLAPSDHLGLRVLVEHQRWAR